MSLISNITVLIASMNRFIIRHISTAALLADPWMLLTFGKQSELAAEVLVAKHHVKSQSWPIRTRHSGSTDFESLSEERWAR